MARIVSVRAIFTLRTQKYTARESLKSTSNAQVLRLRAPHNHVISSVAQRRTFHSTRGCLLQDDIQGSARGTQSVGAKESPAITDEEAEQFAAGTHRWLQEPAQKMARGSLLVDKYRAPNLGFIKVITLNELRTFNALSRQMVSELREEVDSIHAEDSPGETRVLIIRSEAEKAFCAGANLKERANMTIEECVEPHPILCVSLTASVQTNFSMIYVRRSTDSQHFQSQVSPPSTALRLVVVWSWHSVHICELFRRT